MCGADHHHAPGNVQPAGPSGMTGRIGPVVSLSGCYLPDERASAEPPTVLSEGGAARLISCQGYTLKSAWIR